MFGIAIIFTLHDRGTRKIRDKDIVGIVRICVSFAYRYRGVRTFTRVKIMRTVRSTRQKSTFFLHILQYFTGQGMFGLFSIFWNI